MSNLRNADENRHLVWLQKMLNPCWFSILATAFSLARCVLIQHWRRHRACSGELPSSCLPHQLNATRQSSPPFALSWHFDFLLNFNTFDHLFFVLHFNTKGTDIRFLQWNEMLESKLSISYFAVFSRETDRCVRYALVSGKPYLDDVHVLPPRSANSSRPWVSRISRRPSVCSDSDERTELIVVAAVIQLAARSLAATCKRGTEGVRSPQASPDLQA